MRGLLDPFTQGTGLLSGAGVPRQGQMMMKQRWWDEDNLQPAIRRGPGVFQPLGGGGPPGRERRSPMVAPPQEMVHPSGTDMRAVYGNQSDRPPITPDELLKLLRDNPYEFIRQAPPEVLNVPGDPVQFWRDRFELHGSPSISF